MEVHIEYIHPLISMAMHALLEDANKLFWRDDNDDPACVEYA